MSHNKSDQTSDKCGERFSFLRREDGAIAAWFAISIPIFIGFAALAIDMSFGYTMRNKAQVTASSAALAGAAMLPQVGATSAEVNTAINNVRNEALNFATLNMPGNGLVLDQNDILVGNWNSGSRTFSDQATAQANGLALDAVKVTTRLSDASGNPISLFFAGFFGHDTANVNTAAIAVNGGGSPQDACLLSLEPTESDGLYINGNITITSPKCGVCVNSSNPSALRANGTPTIDVGDEGAISVHGGISETPNVNFNPAPKAGQGACNDPYAGVPDFDDNFTNDSCASQVSTYEVGKVTHFPPGVYCGKVKLNGSTKDVVFDSPSGSGPQVHHFIDAEFSITGNAVVNGTDVTILLTRSELKWAGTSQIHLTAGASGFVFYQNPDDPPGAVEHAIGGNNDAFLDGIQYFGMQDVKYHGTTQQGAGGAPECSVVAARKYDFKGTVDLFLDATNCGSDLSQTRVSDLNLTLVD